MLTPLLQPGTCTSVQEARSHGSLLPSTLAPLHQARVYVTGKGGVHIATEADPHLFVINTCQIERKILKGYLLSSQHPWGAVLATVITGNIFDSASFLTARLGSPGSGPW